MRITSDATYKPHLLFALSWCKVSKAEHSNLTSRHRHVVGKPARQFVSIVQSLVQRSIALFLVQCYWTVAQQCYYSALVGERSIAISLSVCVCLSASISLEPLDRSSRNFVCRSAVTVARSSSDGVALCYVLPVLWMPSSLVVVGRMAMRGWLNL